MCRAFGGGELTAGPDFTTKDMKKCEVRSAKFEGALTTHYLLLTTYFPHPDHPDYRSPITDHRS